MLLSECSSDRSLMESESDNIRSQEYDTWVIDSASGLGGYLENVKMRKIEIFMPVLKRRIKRAG